MIALIHCRIYAEEGSHCRYTAGNIANVLLYLKSIDFLLQLFYCVGYFYIDTREPLCSACVFSTYCINKSNNYCFNSWPGTYISLHNILTRTQHASQFPSNIFPFPSLWERCPAKYQPKVLYLLYFGKYAH